MKTKYLFMPLVLASILLCFLSCSKDDDSNALSGTLWSKHYTSNGEWYSKDQTEYIEFVDNTRVKAWNSYWGREATGTYTVDGSTIKFSDFVYDNDVYVEATFTSNSLKVYYYNDGGTDRLWSITYKRE